MLRKTWRRAVVGLGMLGLLIGCGGGPPELGPPTDPPKPFPGVNAPGDKAKPARGPTFPSVK